MKECIPLLDQTVLDSVCEAFECHVDAGVLRDYTLPGVPADAQVVVGLSGGADSSVLAMFCATYLSHHYHNITYLFTDTGAEPVSAYRTLNQLESTLGITIERITPERGLFELIEHYNGFLPNSKARWCTRELKVEPLKRHLRAIGLGQGGVVNLAGIRADEADREGLALLHSMEHPSSVFPFVDLEMTKTAVFDILERTVGIPETYLYRSRSGCYSCFFQRNQEILGMLVNEPGQFAQTEALEKLSPEDERRWALDPDAPRVPMGFYPVPSFVDVRKAGSAPRKRPAATKPKKDRLSADLFADQDLAGESLTTDVFVAYALYVDPRLSWFGGREFTPGTYYQQFVTLSTSLTGLNASLTTYHRFRSSTPMPHFDVADMKIVIAQLRFPAGAVDLGRPSKDSFTWKSGVAYKQLRYLASRCHEVLNWEELVRREADLLALVGCAEEDRSLEAQERLAGLEVEFGGVKRPTGRMVWEGLFTPTQQAHKGVQFELEGVGERAGTARAKEGLEFDEVPTACLACSI